jgi:acyl-CoA dehydrogenase
MMATATHDAISFFQTENLSEPDDILRERAAVRAFLASARESGLMRSQCDSWLSGYSPDFSRVLGAQGWVGMTWPSAYGGREQTSRMRFAVGEELVAGGAPVAAHWFSDRQVGPSLLKHGSELQRQTFLPAMARGELYFCIGMSEPESGSDLGSVRTRATRSGNGWLINGQKIWTSHAAEAHYMLALVRTGSAKESSASALTQVIIDMRTPGLTVRPIPMMDGRADFCEVFFDDAFVSDDMVVGVVGGGWHQVLSELVFERSGPERFLSTFPMLEAFGATLTADADESVLCDLGRLLGRLSTLREMSAQVNANLHSGATGLAAALVKDVGTRTELESIQMVADHQPSDPGADEWLDVGVHLRQARAHSPGFTLRGGTNEILRGIVARGVMPR